MALRAKLWYLTGDQQRELRGLYNRMVFAPAEPPRSPQLGSFALNPARPGACHPARGPPTATRVNCRTIE